MFSFCFLQKTSIKNIFFLSLSLLLLFSYCHYFFGGKNEKNRKSSPLSALWHLVHAKSLQQAQAGILLSDFRLQKGKPLRKPKEAKGKKRDDMELKQRESERVKRYQREHPGYWKRKKSSKKVFLPLLLRDFAQGQKVTDFIVLRDFVFYLSGCFTGFVGHSTGLGASGVLRDNICSVMNTFYDKGIALSKEGCATIFKEDFPHETEGNRGSVSAQARA